MRTGSLATEVPLTRFRQLMLVALVSGTVAGLAWFGFQYIAVLPLIAAAEKYETAAHDATPHEHAGEDHEEGWHPEDGWQRNSLTAAATVLTGIGFASILFAVIALLGKEIDARSGPLWGLAAFVCFALAPALGLPPQPPGTAVADVSARQIWWAGTAVASAVGLYWIVERPGAWMRRVAGVVIMAIPHFVGAPVASGANVVPAGLVRQFMVASLVTTGLFWVVLGVTGGFVYRRYWAEGGSGSLNG